MFNDHYDNKTLNRMPIIDKRLITLFVLSLVSIRVVFLLISFVVSISSFSSFPYTYFNYMWICLLFIPIPLISMLLGIKYKKRKHRCKKNIIAGLIVTILFATLGSFSLAFKNVLANHDKSHINKLPTYFQTLINPDDITLSYTEHFLPSTNYVMVIKMKQTTRDKFTSYVNSNYLWYDDMESFPKKVIDSYSKLQTLMFNHYVMYSETNKTFYYNETNNLTFFAFNERGLLYACSYK